MIEVDTSPAELCGNGIPDPLENPNGDLETGEPVAEPVSTLTTEETSSPVVLKNHTSVETPATPTPQKTAQTPVRKLHIPVDSETNLIGWMDLAVEVKEKLDILFRNNMLLYVKIMLMLDLRGRSRVGVQGV